MKYLNVSIVIYNNSVNDINKLLGQLLKVSCINKILLLDNSPIELNGIIKNKLVEYKYNGRNLGFGKAHNIALNESIMSKTPYHLVANLDIEFMPSSIDAMIDFMIANRDVGNLMPKILYPDKSIQQNAKLLPTPIDYLIRVLMPNRILKKFRNNYTIKSYNYDRILNVPFLSGCFMLLRTSALEDIGLFDERYFLYAEDLDLSRRIHVKYKTIINPSFEVLHEHQKESSKSVKIFLIHLHSVIKYFNKFGWLVDKERSTINKKCLASL